MSDFLKEQDAQRKRQLLRYKNEIPEFVSSFIDEELERGTAESSLVSYLSGIKSFLLFLWDTRLRVDFGDDTEIKDIPLFYFSDVTEETVKAYQTYLQDKEYSLQTVIKKLTSLSVFLKYLRLTGQIKNDPMARFNMPENIKRQNIILLQGERNALVVGAFQTSKYLAKDKEGKYYITKPPYAVKIKRERTEYRNAAILATFISAGLRISELIALNVEDLNLEGRFFNIRRTNGDYEQVYFDEFAVPYLTCYVKGDTIPPHLLKGRIDEERIILFARDHMCSPSLKSEAAKFFKDDSEEFMDYMERMAFHIRHLGRYALTRSDRPTDALFLSSRGTRMSKEMITKMVKEMCMTYINRPDANQMSPQTLRDTYKANMLKNKDYEYTAAQMGIYTSSL